MYNISGHLKSFPGTCDAKQTYIITHLSATIQNNKRNIIPFTVVIWELKYNNPMESRVRIPSFKVTLQLEAQYASNNVQSAPESNRWLVIQVSLVQYTICSFKYFLNKNKENKQVLGVLSWPHNNNKIQTKQVQHNTM